MGGNFSGRRRRRPGPLGPFLFGDTTVEPGSSVDTEVQIARLPAGTWISMPVVVVHGANPGPTIWLSATIHGDELNGVEIIRRVVDTLDPASLTGTVLAVPIVNVFGVSAGTRTLPDRRDLNRSFPGTLRGSLASRLARLFFDHVASRCELGIDFHTGSGGRCNLPQLRCDLDDRKTRRMATAFGAPVALHSNLRDGSLRAAAHAEGIRILLFEGGEANRFDRASIEVGVRGALGVMHALAMLEEPPANRQPAVISRSSRWFRAARSGFCHLEVALGDRVRPRQVLARIVDGIGHGADVVTSKTAGVVIGTLQTGLVHRGDALVHVAETLD